MTKKAEEILGKYKLQITGEEYRSMKTNLDTLMRIKLSNNIPYIQSLVEELFESIRRIVLRYDVPALATAVTSSDDQGNQVEDDYAELVQGQIHQKAIKNASVLGRLKSISEHLNILNASARIHSQQVAGTLPQSTPAYLWKTFLAGFAVITALNSLERRAAREQWKKLRQAWREWRAERLKTELPKLPLILNEVRTFVSWLLGFYLFFFIFPNTPC